MHANTGTTNPPGRSRRPVVLQQIVLAALLLCLVPTVAPAAPTPPDVEELFRDRDWEALDRLAAGGTSLDIRDEAFIANAYWLQQRWGDALELLEGIEAKLPEAVRPYAEMMRILGYERTGRPQQALPLARALSADAPPPLRFYVAYAGYRLAGEAGGDTESWLQAMEDNAATEGHRQTLLTVQLQEPGGDVRDALAMLDENPHHGPSLAILRRQPEAERGPDTHCALGYQAFLQGEFARAAGELAKVPAGHAKARKARYYQAMSHYRRKEYGQAFRLFKELAERGGGYSASSVVRLSILARHAYRKEVLDLLATLAKQTEGRRRLEALEALAWLGSEPQRRWAEQQLIANHPETEERSEVLWERGWESWQAGSPAEARTQWEKALQGETDHRWRARFLYWTARALEEEGNDQAAREHYERLRSSSPRSVYAWMAYPDGPYRIVDALPEELQSEPGPLESWGFVLYARLVGADSKNPAERYRAARLGFWLGNEASAYREALSVSDHLAVDGGLSRPLLEMIYPLPYREEVCAAAAHFGVEPWYIWATMRQESAFDADIRSWVGAVGLMQLMPATLEWEASTLGLDDADGTDPADNIHVGTAHLARRYREFKRPDLASAAYNAGASAVRRWLKGDASPTPEVWLETVGYEETADYARRVMGGMDNYRHLYEDRGICPRKGEGNPE
ncbi:MAG: lytic transglycosylase domain-containing protein [Synergistales bacterium]|nr:lytic transglycosylase domain-containing protein [Synergistales bacterium]